MLSNLLMDGYCLLVKDHALSNDIFIVSFINGSCKDKNNGRSKLHKATKYEVLF